MPTIPIKQAVVENCEDIAELKRCKTVQAAQIAAAQLKAEMAAKQPRFVYSISDVPLGFTWERWGPRAGSDDRDEAAFDLRWGGAVVDGIPTHTDGAPTTSGVETDTRYSPSDTGQDEHRLCYWVYNDRAVPIEIQDIDTRAESIRVYAGCDCPSSLVHERYQTGGGTPYHSQGERFLTVPPGGLVKMTVLIHDPGPDASGFRPIANEVGDAATFTPTSYQVRPSVECREIVDDACDRYVLAEGESFKPIVMSCLDCGGGGEGGLSEEEILALVGDHAEPATAAPIADNEADAAIRTGQVGTSALYARSDHNHPIRRQANPGDPVITAAGTFSIIGNPLILDRWSDEESYAYAFRVRVTQPAGTGWGWLAIPNIAGFQRPEISAVGAYRFSTLPVQLDDNSGAGTNGAGPRGAFMGKEVHHWSSTQRVYGAYLRRDNVFNAYVEFIARYTRT